MPKAILDKEIAQIQGTLMLIRDGLETALSEDVELPDIAKGMLIGVFAGVPAKVHKSLEILNALPQIPKKDA